MNNKNILCFIEFLSKVSLPVTMECIETKTNIKHEISSFTILLGSTINNNATCIYISSNKSALMY